MTPTLFGRWQQRLVLLPTLGLLISLPLAIVQRSWYYILVLIYIGISGCLWDMLYQQLQKMRWDNDWPGLLQLAGGVGEGILLMLLIQNKWLPGINTIALSSMWLFPHYVIVSVAMFLATQSCLPTLFPHARYQGHQWR
jgi:hypothetical protein